MAPSRRAALTQFDFAKLPIDQMPPDDGNVSPEIATEDEAPVGSSAALLKRVEVGAANLGARPRR